MALRCKGCGSEEHVKNGFMRGKQRYRCKACGLNFTDTPPRGMPLRVKVEAVLLYLSGLSMNRTAKLLARVCGLWAYTVPCCALRYQREIKSTWACRCTCGHTTAESQTIDRQHEFRRVPMVCQTRAWASRRPPCRPGSSASPKSTPRNPSPRVAPSWSNSTRCGTS